MKKQALATALVAGLVFVPVPAEADWDGGSIRHVSPDPGYNPSILVRFADDDTRTYGVAEGKHSDWHKPNGKEDVDWVYVRKNEEIWCLERSGSGPAWWVLTWDKKGWHSVGNFQNKLCQLTRENGNPN